MARINEHYAKLPASYLFPEIGRRVRAYQAAHPDAKVIRLGIGDVTEPLAPAIVEAMHAAVDEMGKRETFRGYGPEQGYDFLVEAIRAATTTRSRGVDIAADEIFVSDGSKCDSGNVQEIFALAARVAVTDPVYPVYVDSNVMAGRTAGRRPRWPLPRARRTSSAPRRTASSPSRRPSRSTSSTCARRTTRPARSRRARSSSAGSRGRGRTTRSSCSTPRTRRTSPIRRCRARSTRSTGARDVRDRAAQLLQARGLHRRALRVHGRAEDGHRASVPTASASRSTRCGRGATRRSSTARRTSCSAAPRRRTRPRASRRPTRRSRSTWRTRGCSARASTAAGFTCSAACTRRTSGCARRAARPSWEFFDRLLSEAQVVGTPGAGFGPAGEGYFRLSALQLAREHRGGDRADPARVRLSAGAPRSGRARGAVAPVLGYRAAGEGRRDRERQRAAGRWPDAPHARAHAARRRAVHGLARARADHAARRDRARGRARRSSAAAMGRS